MSEKKIKEKGEKWDIRVIRIDGTNTRELEHVGVPSHRLEKSDLSTFLKALLSKHSGQDAESLLENFVNGRKGSPPKRSSWELVDFFDPKKKSHGYYCGEKPLFATASLPLSDEAVAFYKRVRAENRGVH